jgi:hypothetical protein
VGVGTLLESQPQVDAHRRSDYVAHARRVECVRKKIATIEQWIDRDTQLGGGGGGGGRSLIDLSQTSDFYALLRSFGNQVGAAVYMAQRGTFHVVFQ